MKKPNLFDFATSELSQDAFICWFISWAKLEYKNSDPMLHETAINLLNTFFHKHDKKPPTAYDSIEIQGQDQRIDVLLTVNEKIAILIEDKTFTEDSLGQLERYLSKVIGKGYERDNILGIYFKTGDQDSYEDIEKKGYKAFLRRDFLDVLKKGIDIGVDHPIFVDYFNYLQGIDDRVNSYKELPVGEWKSWIGFYVELQEHLENSGWSYVPNQNGGFTALYWKYQGNGYLQLEEERLCFKIGVHGHNKDDYRGERTKWHDMILEKSKDVGLNVRKPDRFGSGKTMTVAVLEGDYRQTRSDGMLDMDKTLEVLHRAEKVLDLAIS